MAAGNIDNERAVQLGDIVLYMLDFGPNVGLQRPAIVTQVHANNICDLDIFHGAHDLGANLQRGDGLPTPLLLTHRSSRPQGTGHGRWVFRDGR